MSRQNGAAAHGTAPRNAREFAGFSLCGGEGFCRRLRAAESWERGTLLKRVRPGARKISERVSFCSPARLCTGAYGPLPFPGRAPDFPLCGCGFRRGFAQAVFPASLYYARLIQRRGGFRSFESGVFGALADQQFPPYVLGRYLENCADIGV